MTQHEPDVIPAPKLVAAWEALHMLAPESVPLWAAHWLAQGFDGENLIALAGLDTNDVREIHDLLPGALQDAGVEPVTELAAAARLTFDHIARMHLTGKAGWRWVLTAVEGAFEQNGYADALFSEPLGTLFGWEEEIGQSWGRQDAAIESGVRDACERQVALLT